MRRLTLASAGIRRMLDKPAKRAATLGWLERAVKHDRVIFGQLEVERGPQLRARYSARTAVLAAVVAINADMKRIIRASRLAAG